MRVATPWYVYVLECRDGSLYTGVARDVDRRERAHNRGRGAKYTRGRRPVRLLASSAGLEKREAFRLEAKVKRLTRGEKVEAVRREGGARRSASTGARVKRASGHGPARGVPAHEGRRGRPRA